MGYHFGWKIGGKSAEIGRICKHVGRWGTISRTWVENDWKIGEIPPKIAILSCGFPFFYNIIILNDAGKQWTFKDCLMFFLCDTTTENNCCIAVNE